MLIPSEQSRPDGAVLVRSFRSAIVGPFYLTSFCCPMVWKPNRECCEDCGRLLQRVQHMFTFGRLIMLHVVCNMDGAFRSLLLCPPAHHTTEPIANSSLRLTLVPLTVAFLTGKELDLLPRA
jgi:hypothetical protein